MAKINLPLMSAEVRGKFGDVVFMKRYGQQIARVRTKPSNPKTEKQMTVRHNLGNLAKAYKGENVTLKKIVIDDSGNRTIQEVTFNGLTATERQAWENYATRQNKPRIYGRLLFVGINAKRLTSGQNAVRTPA